ncbi:TATA box binding protein [Hokovirus HKV1]|uniref:TATA box binding protein n=1 Tax=Hokovirus HKV1 TaxID=1977638 RepID=A0A1V0SFY7_9VIRU|nr:TATA box binding protein [Hokovirus HKV1]
MSDYNVYDNFINKRQEVNNTQSLKDLDKLPPELKISTITMTFELDIKFNVKKIAKYIDLKDGLIYAKFGKKNMTNYILRSTYLITDKFKKKTVIPKKKPDTFVEQCTIKILSNIDKKFINIKIFENGTLHITGIKSYNDFMESYDKLIKELLKEKYVLKNGILKRKYFFNNVNNVKEVFDNKNNFKICMIVCTFYVYFKIKLEILDDILQKQKYNTVFNFTDHACVNIKYNYSDTREISIFVYESGKINITGSRINEEIIECYKFIIKILYENYDDIVLIDITRFNIQTLLDL